MSNIGILKVVGFILLSTTAASIIVMSASNLVVTTGTVKGIVALLGAA